MSQATHRLPRRSKVMLSGQARPDCGPPARKISNWNVSPSGLSPSSMSRRIWPVEVAVAVLLVRATYSGLVERMDLAVLGPVERRGADGLGSLAAADHHLGLRD